MSTVLDPQAAPAKPRRLMTIDEYAQLPDDGRLTELVRGEVVEMPSPKPRHGQVCNRTATCLTRFADEHERGHVVINDTGIVTARNPDTLRGADVAFYSYARVPKGPLPNAYLAVAPEVVFEMRSPDDRWKDILKKIAELLRAGVIAVCVLDPEDETACVYTDDASPRTFAADQILELPEPLADFRIEVRRFVE